MKITFWIGFALLIAAPVAAQDPVAVERRAAEAAREAAEAAKEAAKASRFEFDFDHKIKIDMDHAMAQVHESMDKLHYKMPGLEHEMNQLALKMPALSADMAAMNAKLARDFSYAWMPQFARAGREEADYRQGKSALDGRDWDRAVFSFDRVISARGANVDGALYWKAYALNKLGRRDDALAALAQLQTEHASSNWLNEGKLLEIEVKQSGGRPVSPEDQTNEDLKIYAINSLVNTEPERALPLLEKIITTSTSPKLKERALFVLAQTKTPRAMEILTKMAQGGANPDLRPAAVQYLGDFGGASVLPMMAEIYSSTNDQALKRTILRVYQRNKDKERLLAAATSESNERLRRDATQHLGSLGALDELMKLYDSGSSIEAKQTVIHALHSREALDKLTELLRREKEAKLRLELIRMLGNHRTTQTAETLASLYGSESDLEVRKTVVQALSNQESAKLLVELARKESNIDLKKYIVQRLSRMRSKEANDFLVELLSKP